MNQMILLFEERGYIMCLFLFDVDYYVRDGDHVRSVNEHKVKM